MKSLFLVGCFLILSGGAAFAGNVACSRDSNCNERGSELNDEGDEANAPRGTAAYNINRARAMNVELRKRLAEPSDEAQENGDLERGDK